MADRPSLSRRAEKKIPGTSTESQCFWLKAVRSQALTRSSIRGCRRGSSVQANASSPSQLRRLTSVDTSDERRFLEAARIGDERAFSRLASIHGPGLREFCLFMLG